MSNENIFITLSECNDDENRSIVSRKGIMKSIPKDALKEENLELNKTHIQLRWRIFKIPNKENEIVEISYKHPIQDRMYINKNGQWFSGEIDKIYDKYVVEEYFVYTK